MAKKTKKDLTVVGWREWVGLPDWGIASIKAKVDTGARSSSLHVVDLEQFERDGVPWVRFRVHPVQRKSAKTVEVEAPVLETRLIRSSNGKVARRPVIVTNVTLLGNTWPVELTLASRDEMGFRMLLGREAVRRRFLVDAGASYLRRQAEAEEENGSSSREPVRLQLNLRPGDIHETRNPVLQPQAATAPADCTKPRPARPRGQGPQHAQVRDRSRAGRA